MPPFILWMIGALGGVALLRWLAREGRRVNAELNQMRSAHDFDLRHEPIPTLRRDPKTGTYRPE